MLIIKRIKRWARNQLISLKYFLSNEKCTMTLAEAESLLDGFHPMIKTSAISQNTIGELQYDLIIIVPAYNAESWIEECIDSILDQETEYSFLVKVIDDGSTDSTGELLDKFSFDKRVEIIHQENRGHSGARNRGLEYINSQYIMFVDADDYLLPGAISCLLSYALAHDMDIVEGNGYRFDCNGVVSLVKESGKSSFSGYPWMKVYRSELFETIKFPEGLLYEDKIIGSLVLQIAKKKEAISDVIYAYRLHPESITQTHDNNPRRLDSYWMMWLMQWDQEKLGIMANYENYVKALRQIVFTYRRTICLPEEIKKAVFIGSKNFIKNYYDKYVYNDNKYRRLSGALMRSQYGKYKAYCENCMI